MLAVTRSPALEAISQHIDHFLFVRSLQNDNASLRIHMIAAEDAIEQSGAFTSSKYTPAAALPDIPPRTCIVFYYGDEWAANEIRKHGLFEKSALSLCFGSDIRIYSQYKQLSDIVDCFLMPSQYHADILSLGLMNRTAVVRESVDPFFVSSGEKPIAGRGRNVVWFGYSEGFLRGLDPLFSVVQECQRAGYIDRFAAITNRRTLDPRSPDVEIIEYSSATIIEDMRKFDYALLSHIPGDLHINSLIKSPNKAISTLVAGLVPLASNTLNYRDVLTDLGLERFLFDSPYELYNLLRNLDVQRDLDFIRDSGVAAHLRTTYSLENIFADFIEAGAKALEDVAERRRIVAAGIGQWEEKSFVGFGGHLKNIIPSAIRAVTMRRRAKG